MNRFGGVLLLVFLIVAMAFGYMVWTSEEMAEPASGEQDQVSQGRSADGALVVPVSSVKAEQLSDTWGDSRGGGERTHNAIDIMAPRGTPVVAAAPGTVEKLFDSRNGGRTIYVRSNDGGTVFYYAHLDSYRSGLREGQRVRTGDVIGAVGSTGSASEDAPHLHFEIKRMAAGDGWWQGREVNPYPLLAGNRAAR